jgi:hypothetical protein
LPQNNPTAPLPKIPTYSSSVLKFNTTPTVHRLRQGHAAIASKPYHHREKHLSAIDAAKTVTFSTVVLPPLSRVF